MPQIGCARRGYDQCIESAEGQLTLAQTGRLRVHEFRTLCSSAEQRLNQVNAFKMYIQKIVVRAGATTQCTGECRRAATRATRTAPRACASSARWWRRCTRAACASYSTSSTTTPSTPRATVRLPRRAVLQRNCMVDDVVSATLCVGRRTSVPCGGLSV